MSLMQDGFQEDSLFRVVKPEDWDTQKLTEILGHFKNKRVLIVGDLGVDRYTEGSVERISPEAPVPIVRVQKETLKLGLAANVADNISDLGGIAQLIGVVGQDRSFEDFQILLKSKKLDIGGLVVDSSRRTVLKERIVSENQQLLRVDYENIEPLSEKIESAITEKIKNEIKDVGALVIEDYAKGLLSQRVCQEAISIAKQNSKRTLADPNGKSPIEFYQNADFLTPNRKEAEELTGKKITNLKSLYDTGRSLIDRAMVKQVMITLGKDGVAIFDQNEDKATWIPTCAQEVYDVSGAGDTVISTLTLALLAGASLEEAAILGNIAAGIVVGKRGTATTGVDEVCQSVKSLQNSDNG